MLQYKKGNLFDAEEDSVLIHACNSKGVMGSGIAKEMRERFPTNYKYYNTECQLAKENNSSPSGYALVYMDPLDEIGYKIANLITSDNFGPPDEKENILINTTTAIFDMINVLPRSPDDYRFHSNKFNSGLFNVPWEETEKIIKYFVNRYDLDWTVWEL